jgi:hypothetical protein
MEICFEFKICLLYIKTSENKNVFLYFFLALGQIFFPSPAGSASLPPLHFMCPVNQPGVAQQRLEAKTASLVTQHLTGFSLTRYRPNPLPRPLPT